MVVSAARRLLNELRAQIVQGATSPPDPALLSPLAIRERLGAHLQQESSPSIRGAVNATGIILHTGLGRAVLSEKAVEAICEVSKGYCSLAIDIETGRRGHRDAHLEGLLCALTGAEAATIVNNNAAATMLILNTLAKGKEVIVSRGQLIEIGGSFRMPEVMQASGALLREVGTTNKTHLSDYASAINENTAALMRVHQSNYRIIGFAEEPPLEELVGLARKHNLPLIDDLGSGALVDLREFGLAPEPLVQHSIKAGVEVACFSGDKLIGGPQAGIIVGRAPTIEKIRKNPLARALRVDKLTIAAMEATLRLFLNRERLAQDHPTYRMLCLTPKELHRRAGRVARRLRAAASAAADIQVLDDFSQAGSGSLPTQMIPTRILAVKPKALSSEGLAKALRHNSPPIFTRIHNDAVCLDFRTIRPEEDRLVQEALLRLLKGGTAND